MADELKMLEELEALEKKAIEAPWRVEEDQKLHIVCDTFSGGKPYTGFVGSFAHYDTRDFVIAARNALPTLLRLARRGLEADALAQRAERLLRDFELAMVAKNAEIGELTQRAERAEAECEKLTKLIQRASDTANAARMAGSNVLATMYDALKDIGGLYDAALSPAPAAAPMPPGSIMLPDLWTIVDGEGTRVGGILQARWTADVQLQQIEGTPGSIHGPYRVVVIPAHPAETKPAAPDAGGAA